MKVWNPFSRLKVKRPWGHYVNLFSYKFSDESQFKLKLLVVEPGKSLSFQRHRLRGEIHFVVQGTAHIYTQHPFKDSTRSLSEKITLNRVPQGFNISIGKHHWHQIHNRTKEHVLIVELQYGSSCSEADIERSDITLSHAYIEDECWNASYPEYGMTK